MSDEMGSRELEMNLALQGQALANLQSLIYAII
jgi:hypothetical protein